MLNLTDLKSLMLSDVQYHVNERWILNEYRGWDLSERQRVKDLVIYLFYLFLGRSLEVSLNERKWFNMTSTVSWLSTGSKLTV